MRRSGHACQRTSGAHARPGITKITLLAGFASTVSFLSAAALVEDLVKAGKASDPDDIVRHAEDACIAITTRYRLGQRAVRAQELADLRALFTAWSEATEGMTQGEKFQAEQRIVRRMECGQMKVLEVI